MIPRVRARGSGRRADDDGKFGRLLALLRARDGSHDAGAGRDLANRVRPRHEAQARAASLPRAAATHALRRVEARAAERVRLAQRAPRELHARGDRKSTRLNSSHVKISYAV